MSNIQSAIFNELKNDAAISTKVLHSGVYFIFNSEVPKEKLDTGEYWIDYQRLPSRYSNLLDIENSTFQINAISNEDDKASDLAEDIKRVLTRFKGNLGSKRVVENVSLLGEQDLGKTPDTNKFIIALTFKFKYFGLLV